MSDAGRFAFPAVAESLSTARSTVRGVLTAHNYPSRELDINIAVGEILQNVVRYGFQGGDPAGEFVMEFTFEADRLRITITDNAPPSDPESWSADHRKPEEGGHGLTLVTAIASQVTFTMLENGNQAELEFVL